MRITLNEGDDVGAIKAYIPDDENITLAVQNIDTGEHIVFLDITPSGEIKLYPNCGGLGLNVDSSGYIKVKRELIRRIET